MPSVDGEESGEEEVERSPNEDENMSEDEEDEDDSSCSSDDSSDSVDEADQERRRTECLDDMADLEKQFTDLKEQLYKERISQIETKLDEVTKGVAQEYVGPLNELKEMCEVRIEVAGILHECRLDNVKNKCEAEEQATTQHFESEKMSLMEEMRTELEEKIRKLEEDRQNRDISADLWLESRSIHKRHRRSDGVLGDKRRKPIAVTGPYIVYMLKEMDILEDWAAIRKARGAMSRQKHKDMFAVEKNPYTAKYEDGKLLYEGEWFTKGSQIVIDNKENSPMSAIITTINTGEVWVRKEDGGKAKLYIGQLQKGKYRIKKHQLIM